MLGHQLHEKAGEAAGDISHVIASMHVKKFKAKKRTLQNQMVPFHGESIHMTTFVQQLLPQSRCAIVNGGKQNLWIHVKVMVHQLHSHMSSTSCSKLCGHKRTAP